MITHAILFVNEIFKSSMNFKRSADTDHRHSEEIPPVNQEVEEPPSTGLFPLSQNFVISIPT